jgi:hypothetical protein
VHCKIVEVDAVVEGNGDDSDVGVIGKSGRDTNKEGLRDSI